MIERVATGTLQEKVYAAIKESIMRNDLLPGRLLSIDELATGLGVSPTPVREALTRLSSDGLIQRDHNKTARVAEITENDVHETYEVRKLLEPYAFSLVVKTLSRNCNLETKLRVIQQKAEEIQTILVDSNRSLTASQYGIYLLTDMQLQEIAIEALGNTLLGKILSLVGGHSRRIRSFAEAGSDRSTCALCPDINQEHLGIIEALFDSDSRRVRKKVKQHLANAERRTLLAIMSRSEGVGQGEI